MSDDMDRRLQAVPLTIRLRRLPFSGSRDAADRIEELEAQAERDRLTFDALAGAEERCEEADKRIEELESALRRALGTMRGAADVLSAWGACDAAEFVDEVCARTRGALDGTPEEQSPVNCGKNADVPER